MKLIKLTIRGNNGPIPVHINIEMIGDIYREEEKEEYGKTLPTYTCVGCLTHNNGGFRVIETVEQVLNLIHKASNAK